MPGYPQEIHDPPSIKQVTIELQVFQLLLHTLLIELPLSLRSG